MKRRLIRVGAVAVMGILVGGAVLGRSPHAATSFPTPLASIAVGRSPRALAVDARTGHLFVVSEGAAHGSGDVTMLDGATGRLLHMAAVGTDPSAIEVEGGQDRAYVIDDKNITMLDAKSGRAVRTLGAYTTGSSVIACGDETTGHTFVAMASRTRIGVLSTVSMLDTVSGRRLRSVAVDPVIALAVDGHAHRVIVATQKPTIVRGMFVGGGMTTLDSRSGRILHRVALGSMAADVLADGRRGRVYVLGMSTTVSGGSTVIVLDVRTGRLLHTISVGRSASAMALDERTGHLFVAVSVGPRTGVSMLDARSGRVVYSAPLDYLPTTLVVSARSGRVFVANDRQNALYVLDTKSGAIVRTVQMSQAPSAVGVDDHSGRVFIASREAGDGVDSGVRIRQDGPLDSLARILYNIRRLHQTGRAGIVSVFDIRALR